MGERLFSFFIMSPVDLASEVAAAAERERERVESVIWCAERRAQQNVGTHSGDWAD